MTKSLDKTLEAIQNLDDAIIEVKTQRNVMTDESMISDYDTILASLETASENLVNAVVIFQRHERSL